MEEQYSVLMSVYYKEKPEHLRESMDSIWKQSLPTDNFVLVCDGELSRELNAVISSEQEMHKEKLEVVRLKEGVGLGRALNHGMKYCKHDVVARMDSDDISKKERMETQIRTLYKEKADIVGASIEEFASSTECILAVRKLPETQEEILRFAAKRNPFNHPSVMYRKSSVEAVGGYMDCPLFEDYYLWARMLKAGYTGYNIQESLLYMRAGEDMYQRRGGIKYAFLACKFRTKLKKMGISGWKDYWVSMGGQVVVSLIPNKLRAAFYKRFLRKS